MGRDLFGFKAEPFSVYPDNKYFFSSISHDKAISLLEYGINSRKGFMLLTGIKGTGKTMTCNVLKENLHDVNTVVISSVKNDPAKLLSDICLGFGITAAPEANMGMLMDFCVSQYKDGRNNLVIIDNAENISDACLDMLDSLMDIEIEQCKLIQIILCGGPDLHDRLKNVGKKLGPKFTFTVELAALSLKDTADYVEHRLNTALGDDMHLFRKQSYMEIYHYSKGIPSEINRIAQKAINIAKDKKAAKVGPADIKAAAASLYGISRGRQMALLPVFIVIALALVAGIYFYASHGRKDNKVAALTAEQPVETPAPKPQKIKTPVAVKAPEPAVKQPETAEKPKTVTKQTSEQVAALKQQTKPEQKAETKPEPVKDKVPEYGCVKASSGLKIRKQPSRNAASVGNAPNRAKVKLVSKTADGKWWEIQYKGHDGYMFSQFITPAPKSGECR